MATERIALEVLIAGDGSVERGHHSTCDSSEAAFSRGPSCSRLWFPSVREVFESNLVQSSLSSFEFRPEIAAKRFLNF